MHQAPLAARKAFPRFFLHALGLALTFTIGACGTPSEGLGLGRPDFEGRGHTPPLGVVMTRLVAPDPQRPEAAFIELVNTSDRAIDTAQDRLFIQSIAGSIAVPARLWGPKEALRIEGTALAPLDVHSTAGELIVLGETLNLEAYASWGADPNTLPGGLNRLARSQGLEGHWQPLPYPVAKTVAIRLDGEGTSPCVTADANAPSPYAAADCQQGTAPAALWLSRIQPGGLDAQGPSIELFNPSGEALDLHGVQLCSRGRCRPIVPLNQSPNSIDDTLVPPSLQTLATDAPDPGRRRIVLAGGTANSALDLITDLPPLGSADEVMLVAPGQSPTSAEHIFSYLRLSADPEHLQAPKSFLQSLLANAALAPWQNEVLRTPHLPHETLALYTREAGAPFAPSAWTLDDRPFGTMLADAKAPYRACSAPQTPQSPSDLIVAQVTSLGAHGVVILTNLSLEAVDLAGWSLAQGQNSVLALASALDRNASPITRLAPKETLRIAISESGQCVEPFNLCWTKAGVRLAEGEISLALDGAIKAHLQWGDKSLPSLLGPEAAQVGAWPAPNCRVSAFGGSEDLASLVRLPSVRGQSPGDYALGASPIGQDIYVADP